MKPERQKISKRNTLIAEGSYLFRKGLRALFAGEAEFQVTHETSDVSDLLGVLQSKAPDILLVGIDLLREPRVLAHLNAYCPQTIVVCLAGDLAADADVDGLPADLIVSRSQAPVKLLQQVKDLLWPEPVTTRQTSDLHALSESQSTRAGALTNREREVVRLLSDGLTVREAADELGLSCKTVEAHTLNLMRKLDIHNRSTLIEYALASGMTDQRVTA